MAVRCFLILLWWVVSARKWFKGPAINVEHYMIGRAVAIDGVDVESDGPSLDGLDRKIDQ